jgi:poly(3-hydroxybutyrate) depolymerase
MIKQHDYEEIVTRLPKTSGTHPGQGEAYIALPGVSKGKWPLVMAFHGSGRGALSYKDVPFYTRQRDIALSCGFAFAAVSNGPDTFGLDAGYRNAEMLYEYMMEHFCICETVALWGSSAGGLMMQRFFRARPVRTAVLLGIFPVYDPLSMPTLPGMMRAFGAGSDDELRRKAKFLSPGQYPQDIYQGKTIVVAHGTDDHTVPAAQSRAWLAQTKQYGGKMTLVEKPGGHSTENFALYDTAAFTDVLTALNISCTCPVDHSGTKL